MSGGGTRAATLATGALRGLHAATFADGTPLTAEIDILSSVSGGSVTAAYFARHGYDGLARLEEIFLRQNVIGDLFEAGIEPGQLGAAADTGLCADRLAGGGVSQTAVRRRGSGSRRCSDETAPRPNLILNAGRCDGGNTVSVHAGSLRLDPVPIWRRCNCPRRWRLGGVPRRVKRVDPDELLPCAAQDAAWPDHPPLRIINPLSTSAYANPQGAWAAREWGYLNRAYPDDYLDDAGGSTTAARPRRKDWQRALPADQRRQFIHCWMAGSPTIWAFRRRSIWSCRRATARR